MGLFGHHFHCVLLGCALLMGCGQGTLEPKKIKILSGLSEDKLDEFFTEEQSGVQAYYKFDETTFDTWGGSKDFKDYSGRNLHLTVMGGVNPVLDQSGIRGRAITVKDVTDEIQVDRIITDNLTQMSFGIWVRYDGTPKGSAIPIFHSGQTLIDGFGIWLSDGAAGGGDRVVLKPDPAQANTLVSPVSLTANVWTQIFVTYSTANGWKLYINGTLASSGGSLPPNLPTTETVFGAFPGQIDEFVYWKEEMSAQDVFNLYLIQSGQI